MAGRGQLLWTRVGQISHRSLRVRQPVKNISSTRGSGEDERSLLRRIISNWKTPSVVFISGVLGCLFYERFIDGTMGRPCLSVDERIFVLCDQFRPVRFGENLVVNYNEEPDETGKRDPLITRLMMDYLMPDPVLEKQKRDNFLREGREKCDAYLESKRKPRLGKQPFHLEELDKKTPYYKDFGPDGY